ncbi:glycosyltransferase family 4 protein [Winogradskyella vincentii]|uniref:Glycosyltransferase family 4 protein n=1 Tax=Winogradskyella vincentii TaxID=2877122 RepID=A0ABS7XZB5_9FLAO|nr:glycosyltransferase family 4 protein [Winogradskyella vincentii]MCA0152992.1 glycosyltransferase family 4 protein [Winogradskyella vincentii]
MNKIIRITTVSSSLKGLLKGQLRFMNSHYEMIGIASDEDQHLKPYEKREGVKTIHVNMTRKITPIKDLISVYQLYKIIKKEKPLIVHTHTPKAGTVGMLAARLAGVKHRLHTIAGLPLVEATGFKRRILNAVEKFTYSCSTLVLPNSFGMKQIILDEGFCKESKLKVIGNGSSNGINTEQFNPETVKKSDIEDLRAKIGISKGDIIFLFVGRIVKDKGIKELVESFNELTKNFNNISLILVGPKEDHLDPLDAKTESVINSNTKIYCMGESNNVKPYYCLCDVFVFPSYREGFPNVVLEAGSMGKPCVVSDINGSNEIIRQNYNGLIVPKKDSKELTEAIRLLITDSNLLNTLAKNARVNIIQKYQRQAIWDELLQLYKSLEQAY